MGRLVLIEGPDCAGKTTLLETLIGENDERIHNGVYPSQAEALLAYKNQYYYYDLNLSDDEKGNLFIDRAHWSEEVYGSVLRDKGVSDKDWKEQEDLVNKAHGFVILCLPPKDLATTRWAERNANNEEFVTKADQYDKIYDGYNEIIGRALTNVFVYDYSNPSSTISQIDKIRREILS